MSNRERVVELLNSVPDYKIGYVLAYVQGLAVADSFCEARSDGQPEDEA